MDEGFILTKKKIYFTYVFIFMYVCVFLVQVSHLHTKLPLPLNSTQISAYTNNCKG